MNFQYSSGKNLSYSLNYAPITTPANVSPRGLKVWCNYFEVCEDKTLKVIQSKYYTDINYYFSHLNVKKMG